MKKKSKVKSLLVDTFNVSNSFIIKKDTFNLHEKEKIRRRKNYINTYYFYKVMMLVLLRDRAPEPVGTGCFWLIGAGAD